MKALILAAGRGKRLGKITNKTNKCMLKLVSKPVLEYNIERAIELDEINQIIILVGYKAEEIVNYYGVNYKKKKIQYVFQRDQKGLVHAIDSARDALEGDDFFLLLGDEVMINSKHRKMYKKFITEKPFVVCGMMLQKNKEKIKRTYAALTDGSDQIFRLIEKPKKILNNWQGTGHCMFQNEILNYIKRTPIHPERGEKELPDLIQCAIDDGKIVKTFNICDKYTNINSEENLKEALKFFNNSFRKT